MQLLVVLSVLLVEVPELNFFDIVQVRVFEEGLLHDHVLIYDVLIFLL